MTIRFKTYFFNTVLMKFFTVCFLSKSEQNVRCLSLNICFESNLFAIQTRKLNEIKIRRPVLNRFQDCGQRTNTQICKGEELTD